MVPNGWKNQQPTKLFKLFSGFAFKSSDAKESGAKWLKIANVGIGEIKWDADSYLPEEYYSEHKKYLLERGDIVVALTRPTLGNKLKVARLLKNEDKSLLNQRVAKIICENETDSEFIYQVLRSDQFAYRINVGLLGTDPPNLSVKVLEDFTVPIPPLPEQREIAKILSTWDKAITITEKLITTSQQQKKALMQQLLTGKKRLVNPETGMVFEGDWEEVHTGEHINLLSGHAFKSSEFEKHGDFKLLRGINVSKGYLRWELNQTYSWTDITNYKKYIMKLNDVVISMDGSLVGRNYALITENNLEPMLLVQRVARLRCKSSLHHDFLLQHIASNHFKSYVDAVKTITAIPHISAKDIRQFPILLPSYPEQQKIASVLTAADKEIELLQAKLAHLKQEKKALMQQLLTGKKRVKVEAP